MFVQTIDARGEDLPESVFQKANESWMEDSDLKEESKDAER